MDVPVASTVSRQQLAQAFKDQSTLLAVERLLNNVAQPIPDALNQIDEKATTADSKADAAQNTANTANANAGAAQNTANTADGKADTAQSTADGAVADAAAANANADARVFKAGDTMTGPLVVEALLTCDDLRIEQAPTATVTLSTHSIPINCNGVLYYLRLSATP